MIRPTVGLLVFSESLTREDVYRKRKPIAERELARFVAALGEEVTLVRPTVAEIRGKRQAVQAVRELAAAHVEAVILYVPIFVAPAVVAHTANLLTVPTALAGNEAPDSLSQVAFLAVGGAMDQIGLSYLRVPGDAAEEPYRTSLVQFLRAAAACQRLRGQVYGSLGGRALGISTGTADLALWEQLFGVDIEHIDQYEIVRRAEALDPEQVATHVAWLRSHAQVEFNETNFTPAHLDKQVRSYLATREIIAHYELDFLGVKCQPEMSNGYCLQCVNVALCNDPYDAEGAKEPVPCSCEADADGALTMQLLHLLTGQPTSLNDLAWMSGTEMTLANCGAMATHFAAGSAVPEENLAEVHLVPHSFGEAGGAATQFTVPAGCRLTLARLFRRGNRYALGVLTGVTEHKERSEQGATIQTRPLLFLRMDIDKPEFLSTFGSNHIHAVAGDVTAELRACARLLDLDFISYDRA